MGNFLYIAARRLRKGLFSSASDSFVSISIGFIIIYSISKLINWILIYSDWNVVTKNLPLYFFGTYPNEQIWRPLLWMLFILTLTLVTLLGPNRNKTKLFLQIGWVLMAPIGLFLIGGGYGIKSISTEMWGGLMLTIILTIFSAIISLPLGILLALGRQSNYGLIRKLCRFYIDFMRSLPLITVLFFGQLLIPLFLPMEMEISRVGRSILAFSLFSSSYIAEDVRGGLQAIANEQKEACAALGLSKLQMIKLVILPQALSTALPSLTNQAIGLLQNTSLMAILGLVELLGISRSLLANPEYIGRYLEVYIWIALLYWVICTIIALLARKIESNINYLNKT